MSSFALVGASVAVIVLGIFVAWVVRHREPAFSVSRPVTALVLGGALGGPFVLRKLGLLPVPGDGGWDLVAALALSVTLWLAAVQLVGLGENGSDTDTTC